MGMSKRVFTEQEREDILKAGREMVERKREQVNKYPLLPEEMIKGKKDKNEQGTT
jgi:hypothetical protein